MRHDHSLPSDALLIAGKRYRSRLLTGTGKFKDLDETRLATEAAAAEIVTVAIRRVNIGQDPNAPSLLDVLPPDRYTLLPNTAGCYSAEDAVRTCRLARELLDGHNLTKLEVLGDERTLYPDVVQTLKAAEQLVADGFEVMVYTSDDPILAKRLEEIGCVAVMPLAAPIGSGWASRTNTTCWKSSKTPRCRSSSMPAWAPPPMRRLRWNWAATAC